MGAKSAAFQDIGVKEREIIAKELKDMNLFSKTKVTFDPDAGKFISEGKSLESLERPARDKILTRLEDGMEAIQNKKTNLVEKYGDAPIPMEDVEDKFIHMMNEFEKTAGTGRHEKRQIAENIIEKVLSDMELDRLDAGLPETTVSLMEEAKKRLSQDVSHYGKALTSTPDEAKIYKNVYRIINDTLKEKLGDTKYAKYNSMQQKMLTAKADLTKAIATEEAQKHSLGLGGMANKVLSNPDTNLSIANMVEAAQKPGIKQVIRGGALGAMEVPFQTMRSFDTSLPKTDPASLLNPSTPQEKDSGPGYSFTTARPAFRGIQSMAPSGLDMTPMQVAQARLPRTTAGLLKNKDLVVAKLALKGAPSEMIDTIVQALNDDPEAIESIAPMVTMQFPDLFEKSKYNMFDGKILDPNERAKAADQTSKRKDMGSIQKAKIIDELNNTGKWIGE